MMSDLYRICRGCELEKHVSQFGIDRRRKTRRTIDCRVCRCQYQRRKREKRREGVKKDLST